MSEARVGVDAGRLALPPLAEVPALPPLGLLQPLRDPSEAALLLATHLREGVASR